MTLPTYLFCDDVFKYPWDVTEKNPCLTGNSSKIYLLFNMDTVLTNQVAPKEGLVGALKMSLDEIIIGGGYNTKL